MDDNDNLKLYNSGRVVPNIAKKEIKAGNLKGYTDINPVWRIKKLTEMFGAVGIGWYTEIIREWTEQGANGEVIFLLKLNLFIKTEGEWSKPIVGCGGSMLINKYSTGFKSNDEALKMAETDAISVAAKKLGIGADVYFEKDKTKYSDQSRQKPTTPTKPTKPTTNSLTDILECAEKAKLGNTNELLKDSTKFGDFEGYEQVEKVSEKVKENLLKNINDSQLKRMFAISNNKGVSNEQIKAFIKKVWGVSSKKELKVLQYNILCKYMEEKK